MVSKPLSPLSLWVYQRADIKEPAGLTAFSVCTCSLACLVLGEELADDVVCGRFAGCKKVKRKLFNFNQHEQEKQQLNK